MLTPLRKKTITGWAIACIVFIGLLGYEWIPEYLRGGWIFYLLLVISGAFMQIGTSLIVGIVAFLGTAAYLSYKLNLGLPSEKQTLMMFLTPLAPLWLSAIKHNLDLRKEASGLLIKFHQKSDFHVFTKDAFDDFVKKMDSICRSKGIESYRIIKVNIENQEIIEQVLGEQAWQRSRLNILSAFECSIDNEIFHFGNHEFNEFCCVDMQFPAGSTEAPMFLQKLSTIPELKLNISYEIHDVSNLETK